jgi:cell division protein FtsL
MLFLGVFIGTLADRYALERTSFTGRVILSAEQIQAQQDTFDLFQNEVRELQARADTASSELMVERTARQKLEKQLKDSQAETGRAN